MAMPSPSLYPPEVSRISLEAAEPSYRSLRPWAGRTTCRYHSYKERHDATITSR
jgi:hypothetical protein